MTDKIYTLGDVLKLRVKFLAFIQRESKDNYAYKDAERWTDLFTMWMADYEDKE